jgi:hypothetical protein
VISFPAQILAFFKPTPVRAVTSSSAVSASTSSRVSASVSVSTATVGFVGDEGDDDDTIPMSQGLVVLDANDDVNNEANDDDDVCYSDGDDDVAALDYVDVDDADAADEAAARSRVLTSLERRRLQASTHASLPAQSSAASAHATQSTSTRTRASLDADDEHIMSGN